MIEAAGGGEALRAGSTPRRPNPPARDRRGDAGHERARAERAAAGPAAGDEGAVPVGLHGALDVPGGRRRTAATLLQKPFTPTTLLKKVREVLDDEPA